MLFQPRQVSPLRITEIPSLPSTTCLRSTVSDMALPPRVNSKRKGRGRRVPARSRAEKDCDRLRRLLHPLLPGDPVVDPLVEDVERQGAGAQHLVVELADVELRAELPPGALAQLEDLELADL